jgi:flagellar biosynthesis/type III secretory pathway protein FliH
MQKTPPRYVPTLTQVIAPQSIAQAQVPVSVSPAVHQPVSPQPNMDHLAQQLRDQMIEAAHEYINQEMERRIREVASQIALEHAHKIFEELQPELESTIARVVEEAVVHAVMQAAKEPITHAP